MTRPPTSESFSDRNRAPETTIPDDPFCAKVVEVNSQEDAPTMEQVREYAELAPAEIADTAAMLVTALEAVEGNFEALFSDPAIGPAFQELTEFETEYCGFAAEESNTDNSLDPNAIRIHVKATDYMFDMEIPTEAGRHSVVMTNNGADRT